jgi:hypothetical protein
MTYKTLILVGLGALGVAGCGAGIRDTDTDITRMYSGKPNACATISSTAAYSQGLEAFAKSEWGKIIGVGCYAYDNDGNLESEAIDVFDMNTKFVGRTSDYRQAQAVLNKRAAPFDYHQSCELVYGDSTYDLDGRNTLEGSLEEQIGLFCDASRKGKIYPNDLCADSKTHDVYAITPQGYTWVGRAKGCKEAQVILKGLTRGREE